MPNLSRVCNGSVLTNKPSDLDVLKFEYAASIVVEERHKKFLCRYVHTYNEPYGGFKEAAIYGLEKYSLLEITERARLAEFAPRISNLCAVFQLRDRPEDLIQYAEEIASITQLDASESSQLCLILEQYLRLSNVDVSKRLSELKSKVESRMYSGRQAASPDPCSESRLVGANRDDLAMYHEIRHGLTGSESLTGQRIFCDSVAMFAKYPDHSRHKFRYLVESVRGRLMAFSKAPKIANECFLKINLAQIPTHILLKAEESYVGAAGDQAHQICSVLVSYKPGEDQDTISSLEHSKNQLRQYADALDAF